MFNEIPQAANRVVGWVRYRVVVADRVVGAEQLVVKQGLEEVISDLRNVLKQLQLSRDQNTPEGAITPWLLHVAQQRDVLTTVVSILDETIENNCKND